MGLKKRGFGAGRWNGFGGKLAEGETVEAAAKRELMEESGLIMTEAKKCGVLNFTFEGGMDPMEVHVFRVHKWEGEPAETEEMKPQWFEAASLPYGEMWPDDKHWMPLFLSKKYFTGSFHFKDMDTIMRHSIREV